MVGPTSSQVCTKMVNITLSDSKPKSQLSVAVIMFLIGSLGNIIALVFLFLTRQRHKWRPFYRLVVSLAVTDLVGSIFVFPIIIHSSSSNYTFVFPPGLCEYMSFLWAFTFLASAMLVCSMSIDRFLAIVFPVYYKKSSKQKRVNCLICSNWGLASILSFLHICGLGSAKRFYPGSWCFIHFTSKDTLNRVNTLIYSTVGLLVLLTAVTLNVIVLVNICRTQKNENPKGTTKKRNILIIVFLIFLVVLLSVTWTPLLYEMLKSAAFGYTLDGPSVLYAIRMALINGIIDPWLYIFVRRETLLMVSTLFRRIHSQVRMLQITIIYGWYYVKPGQHEDGKHHFV